MESGELSPSTTLHRATPGFSMSVGIDVAGMRWDVTVQCLDMTGMSSFVEGRPPLTIASAEVVTWGPGGFDGDIVR